MLLGKISKIREALVGPRLLLRLIGLQRIIASFILCCFRCWVGKRHLEDAISRFADRAGDIRVEWKPYLLDPNATDEGMPMLTYIAKKYGPQAALNAKNKSGHLHDLARKLVCLIVRKSMLLCVYFLVSTVIT